MAVLVIIAISGAGGRAAWYFGNVNIFVVGLWSLFYRRCLIVVAVQYGRLCIVVAVSWVLLGLRYRLVLLSEIGITFTPVDPYVIIMYSLYFLYLDDISVK